MGPHQQFYNQESMENTIQWLVQLLLFIMLKLYDYSITTCRWSDEATDYNDISQ